MKKSLLTERFQQLAGIKPLYELDEGGAQNDGTPAAKQISTNKPLRNNILKYIESKLKPGQNVERLFQMEDVAKEYIKNYVTEKEPHYKAIADSTDDMHFWYQTMQQHLQGGLDEGLNEDLGGLMAQGEKMAAFANKQSGYEGGVSSPVRGVLASMTAAGAPDFDGDEELKTYWTRRLTKAIETQKGRKYMSGYSE